MVDRTSGIWTWALAVYARPGVPDACLRLQDVHGQQTCLLLWAVWAGEVDKALMARAAGLAQAWDEVAILALRRVRRALKPPCTPIANSARKGLREAVKACELQAERALLDALAELSGGTSGGASSLAALEAASRAWGKPAPREALDALAAALEPVPFEAESGSA